MKKFLGRLLVLALAFAMIFSLAACGNEETGKPSPNPPDVEKPGDDDNKPNTPGDDKGEPVVASKVIGEAVTAMLAQEGFSVGGKLEINSFVIKLNADVASTESGYDFELKAKSGTRTLANVIKKGDINFSYSPEQNVWKTEYSYGALPTDAITEQLTSMLDGVSFGEAIKKDGITTIKFEENYGEPLRNLQKFVAENRNVVLGDYIAVTLGGKEYTRAQLIADITAIFADGNSLSDAVAAIDVALSHMIILSDESPVQITVKTLVDAATLANGLTADDVYEKLNELLPGIDRPAQGATPYDYIMSVFGNEILDDYLSEFQIQGQPLSCEIIRGLVQSILNDENTTVGTVYNMLAELVDQYFEMLLPLIGADEQIYYELVGDNPENSRALFCADNLEKLIFGENGIALSVTFDEKSLPKTLELKLNNNIGYKATADAQEKEFVASELLLELAFDYSAVPEIKVPSFGTIYPLILSESTYLDICEVESGALEFEVFAGTCEMGELSVVTKTGKEISGITYANGKITFSEEAMEAVRNEIYTFDGYVSVDLPCSVNGTSDYPLGIYFYCEHLRVPDLVGVYEFTDADTQTKKTVILTEANAAFWIEGETVKIGEYSENNIGFYMVFEGETSEKIDFSIERGALILADGSEFVQTEHYSENYYCSETGDSITLFTEYTVLLFENGVVSVVKLTPDDVGDYSGVIGNRTLSFVFEAYSITVIENENIKVFTANIL